MNECEVDVKGLDTYYSTAYVSQTQEQQLYNIRSGSWLAWANDTAAHYKQSTARANQQQH